MPNDTTQQPVPQGTPQVPQGQEKGLNPEHMLVQFLKEMEQQLMDLSQRVDVLEQGSQPMQ